MRTLVSIGVASVLAISASAVFAHHSRANFDLDTTVQYEGTVTRFWWKNPHTAIHIETTGPDGKPLEVRFEGNSVATMARQGWNKDSLKVGDKVTVTGNPDRNPKDHFVYLTGVMREDGTRIGSGFQQQAAATEGSADFTGVWRPMFSFGGGGAAGGGGGANSGRSVLLGSPMPSNFKVTPKGAASYARFDGADDPRNNCIPESLVEAISTVPYQFQIIRRPNGDFETINENYAARRVIHMNQSAPPAGTEPDYDGYSIGRMEGDGMVVESTLFSPQPWGNDAGLDSSDQLHVVERYSLEDEGKTLVITYTQTDPVYLAEPVTRTLRWALTGADKLATEWDVSTCDPAAGRRHLDEAANPK